MKAVRPLADNTMRRIIRGVDKFTIKSGQPYIVPTGYGERKGQAPRVHDIEEPLPTVVGSGKHNLCKRCWHRSRRRTPATASERLPVIRYIP